MDARAMTPGETTRPPKFPGWAHSQNPAGNPVAGTPGEGRGLPAWPWVNAPANS